MDGIIKYKNSLSKLVDSENVFLGLFSHGSMKIELFRPDQIDTQQPHEQDEIYVIATGTGTFILEDKKVSFEPNDVIFVPAGKDHRFIDFTEDFTTWVIFYGPKNGE